MMETIHKAIPQPPKGQTLARPASSSAVELLRPHPASDSPGIRLLVLQLFDRCQRQVLGYVLACGLSFHDAEDIVQETFLSLYRHLELGRPRSNLDGWLFRVAHNLALKRRSAIQAGQRKHLDENTLDQQPCSKPNAEQQVLFGQTQRRLRAAFEALPERDRQCLYLRAEGLKYRQIAKVLGISLGAVSLSISRSLARIMRANGSE